jgi:hypothetical protein
MAVRVLDWETEIALRLFAKGKIGSGYAARMIGPPGGNSSICCARAQVPFFGTERVIWTGNSPYLMDWCQVNKPHVLHQAMTVVSDSTPPIHLSAVPIFASSAPRDIRQQTYEVASSPAPMLCSTHPIGLPPHPG